MKNFLFTILATLALLGSQSCGKDTDEFIPVRTKTDTIPTIKKDTEWLDDLLTTTTTLSIEKLMKDLETEPIKEELNAERGGRITTPDNVTLEFPANSCVTQNNRPCTGTLKVEVLMLRKKGELLLNNLPTISGNRQLVSGGAVFVKIKQDDDEVKLARNATYKVKYLPATATEEGMQLFEAKFDGRSRFLDWKLISQPNTGTTNTPIVRVWADSTQGRRNGYELGLDRFNWINCDKFSGDSASLTNKFCVALPDTFTNKNCAVFVVFKDINSVVPLTGDSRTKQFCVPNSYRGLPIGKAVNIITIATIKDRTYIGKKEATITANASIRVEPDSMTKAAAKALISNL